ncbi:MAG TPA: DUF222 domain-containing protein [Acidimicrobiales bacterium]|nr:DUF222 domain-containing protein [Acidimicrobiales bacterium]
MAEGRPPKTLEEASERLLWFREFVAEIDLGAMSGGEAVEHGEFFAKFERTGTAGSMVVAPKIADCFAWRQEGHRTAADFLAAKMGMAPGTATGVLETARQLAELPETANCLRRGDFSLAQVKAIASAASVHPGAEGELIEAAARTGLKGLQRRCERTKALASWENDEVGRENAIRRSRFLRHWTDADGGVRFEAKVAPAEGARIIETVKALAGPLADEARQAGRAEAMSAYAADAFVRLADHAMVGTGTGIGRPTVVLRVDLAALKRGETEDDELCEIPGVGPVSVATARRLLGDCFLKIVIRDGYDIRSVSHPGRSIPALMETALAERDPGCMVPGCDNTLYLETHHRVPVHEYGPTAMDNLVRICSWHHDLISHEGWRIEGGPGHWSWHPPPDFDGL